MDTLQAAVLLAKLETYDDEVSARARIGGRFTEKFERANSPIKLPFIEPHNTSVYAQYTVQVDKRAAVTNELAAAGIPTAVHYPVPLHRQPVFRALAGAADQHNFPVAEEIAELVFSLPMHPYLSSDA